MLRRTPLIVLVVSLFMLLVPNVAAGGGCHASSEVNSARAGGDATIDIEKCGYSPDILYIEPGTEVSWVNRDPVPHTVTGIGLTLGGESELSKGEKTETFRFKDAGVFPYYCIFHPGMAGALVVGDVDAVKASADNFQSIPLAVGAGDDRPQRGGDGDEGSAWLVPMVAVALASLASVVLIVTGLRRRRRRPQTA